MILLIALSMMFCVKHTAVVELKDLVHNMNPSMKASMQHVLSGQQNFNQQNYSKASMQFGRALSIDPQNGYAYWLMGQVSLMQNDFIQAQSHLNKAAGLSLHDHYKAKVHESLAKTYLQQNEIEKAKIHFKKALKLDKDLPQSREYLERINQP